MSGMKTLRHILSCKPSFYISRKTQAQDVSQAYFFLSHTLKSQFTKNL